MVNVKGVGEVPGVFIRAPKIETWSDDLEVSRSTTTAMENTPFSFARANLGLFLHPELTNDERIHRLSSTLCSCRIHD